MARRHVTPVPAQRSDLFLFHARQHRAALVGVKEGSGMLRSLLHPRGLGCIFQTASRRRRHLRDALFHFDQALLQALIYSMLAVSLLLDGLENACLFGFSSL
ncbi:hypothetical protein D9M72_640390 [compost metagenome]